MQLGEGAAEPQRDWAKLQGQQRQVWAQPAVISGPNADLSVFCHCYHDIHLLKGSDRYISQYQGHDADGAIWHREKVFLKSPLSNRHQTGWDRSEILTETFISITDSLIFFVFLLDVFIQDQV